MLDEKTPTEGPARESDDDTHVDDRVVKGPLPGIAIGSIVDQEVVQVDERPFLPAGVAYSFRFGREYPVLLTRLTPVEPESIPLRYRAHHLPDVTADKQTKDDFLTVVFDQGQTAALPPEPPLLPSDESSQPDVEFSTGQDWLNIGDGYAALAEPQIRPQDVKSLLPAQPASDRLALIMQPVMALHKEVVRYTGH